jgi:hypothetical protein
MDDDLRQADLSKLSIRQMTPAQRAELRRRFDTFMAAFGAKPKEDVPVMPSNVKKWVPGMKR